MSDQYGNSNKYTGKPAVNKHPGSNKEGASDDSFSSMRKVDLKEHHIKSIENMSAQPKHIAAIPIDQNHNYKKQSHAVRPAGPIESFVGPQAVSKDPTKTKRPMGSKGKYQEE